MSWNIIPSLCTDSLGKIVSIPYVSDGVRDAVCSHVPDAQSQRQPLPGDGSVFPKLVSWKRRCSHSRLKVDQASKKCFLSIFKCLNTALELSMYTLYYLPRYLCACSVTKSCPTLFWTIACQAALTMGFPRQEYWSELPFSSPEDLSHPRIEPVSPALQVDSLTFFSHLGRPEIFN